MEVIFGGIILILAIVGFVVWVNSMKGIFQMFFKKKAEDKVMEAIGKVNESTRDTYDDTEAKTPVCEWIWVDGYKGTDKDMKCRDYQYELNKCFDISDDKDIKECEHGFHLCLHLRDVLNYYPFKHNNRFFKVKALVRKEDVNNYGYYRDYDGILRPTSRKLVAKSIIFTEELGLDYLCEYHGIGDWTTEQKEKAWAFGVEDAIYYIRTEKLMETGYSETFSRLLANDEYFETAYIVGTQENLSMDMKVWTIFTHDTMAKSRKRR